MKWLILLSAALGASQAFADCTDKYEIYDNTQIQISPGTDACYFTVTPRNVPNLVYRDFLFDTNGDFMIFNSFGQGPESTTTAAREFYFFPRPNKEFAYQYDANKHQLNITLPSGKIASFDTNKSILLSISGTQLKQDYNVTPSNRGGIEVVADDGLLLDIGFKVGQSPSQNPASKATFRDAEGHACQVENAVLFTYTADQDVILKAKTDDEVRSLLKSFCPNLKF